MSLFTNSGGLVYHARALRYRSRLWAPFRAALAQWLDPYLSGGDELILVGPSGGHCLPIAQLRRYRRLLVLEPDPLARRILQLRLSSDQLAEHRDLLLGPLLSGGPGLDVLLQRRPRAALLFCNLLGQVQLELADEERRRFEEAFRERLLPLLTGRRWASFHDRWSLDRDAFEPAPVTLGFGRLPTDAELGEAYFGPTGAPVIALDHGTSALFPADWPRRYFSWQLTPRALHVVEGVASAP